MNKFVFCVLLTVLAVNFVSDMSAAKAKPVACSGDCSDKRIKFSGSGVFIFGSVGLIPEKDYKIDLVRRIINCGENLQEIANICSEKIDSQACVVDAIHSLLHDLDGIIDENKKRALLDILAKHRRFPMAIPKEPEIIPNSPSWVVCRTVPDSPRGNQ